MTTRSSVWVCNPNNPTGSWVEPERSSSSPRRDPGTIVVVDEAYVEYGGAVLRSVGRRAREPRRAADDVEGVRLRRAARRVRGRAPRDGGRCSTSGARRPRSRARGAIAAAALRDPRLATSTRRSRSASGCGRRSSRPATTCRRRRRTSSACRPTSRSPSGSRRRASSCARFPRAIRITVRRPSENDVLLRALGAEPGPAPGREATVIRTTTETALRITLVARRQRPHARRDGNRLPRPPADAAGRSTPASTSSSVAGGDLDVDEHHTVEDVLAALGAALAQALGAREGVARYGSAVVPMDEARATAAVDLVRRPHAEIALAFDGERVGGLAVSLVRARARALRDGGGLHRARRGRRAPTTTTSPRRPSRRSARRSARRSRPAAAGIRSTKGARVKVVLADYGAGNLRSLSSALARAGVEPVVTIDPGGRARRAARGDRRRRPRRERRRAGSPRNGLDDALRERVAAGRPVAGICVGMQLLFEESEEGGERARAARRARAPGARAARAAHGLEHARRRHAAVRRSSTGSTATTSTSPTATRSSPTDDDVVVADGRPRRPDRRRGRVTARSPASSSTPSAARAAGARILENLAAMVKKRVIPCLDVAGGRVVKGVNFVEPARDGRAGRARHAATRSSAPTSSSSSTSPRRSRAAGRSSS